MTATPTASTVHVPDEIVVRRGPNGAATVSVDGFELPFAIGASLPISIDIEHAQSPGVRLTLLARTVRVEDTFGQATLAGADHKHKAPTELEQ